MNIMGRIKAALLQVALWAGLGIVALCLVLTGLAFLIASLYIWLEHVLPHPVAALITGVALFVVAILILLIGGMVVRKMKKQQPTMKQEFNNTIGTAARLVGLVVRRDPRKALIVSAVAGALAEFVTSERRR